MMEHAALVSEIQMVEKMTTAERLKHARKRRTQQLKTFSIYEKNLDKEQKKKKSGAGSKQISHKKARIERIRFVSNVMLLDAAARNDIEEVRYLLMEGVSPDVTNEDGLTALHQCCIDDLENMMRLLIEFGANVNARDSELWTPLHAAATCGHVKLCKILVENGAALLAVNADGNMPYDICEDEHTLDFVESEMAKRGVTQELIDDTRLSTEKTFLEDLQHLASSGGDLQFRGRNGETPLHIASANGYLQVIEFLLDHHVPIDCVDDDQWQPIHCAACWGQVAVLEILCHNGASLDAKTRNSETPLDICEDADIKQRLLEMKDEMETHRDTRTKELKRRRSQNTRSSGMSNISVSSLYNSSTSLTGDKHVSSHTHSASVRRTSMREKSAISWKEAREEAQRLRESAGSDEDDEEDNSQQPPTNQTAANVPATNIDDVHISITDGHSETPADSSSSGKHSTRTPANTRTKTAAPMPPAAQTHSALKTSHPQPSQAHVVTSTNGVSSDSNMNKLSPAAAGNAPDNRGQGSSDMGHISNSEHASNAAPVSSVGHASSAGHASGTHNNGHMDSNSLQVPSGGPSQSSISSNSSSPSDASKLHTPQANQPDSRKSSVSSQGMAAGTLSDLKKQRAQRLQESIKQHSNAWVDSSSTETSNGHATTKPRPNGLNGPDPPMHKYTAPKMDVVGSGDSNDGCCVIL